MVEKNFNARKVSRKQVVELANLKLKGSKPVTSYHLSQVRKGKDTNQDVEMALGEAMYELKILDDQQFKTFKSLVGRKSDLDNYEGDFFELRGYADYYSYLTRELAEATEVYIVRSPLEADTASKSTEGREYKNTLARKLERTDIVVRRVFVVRDQSHLNWLADLLNCHANHKLYIHCYKANFHFPALSLVIIRKKNELQAIIKNEDAKSAICIKNSFAVSFFQDYAHNAYNYGIPVKDEKGIDLKNLSEIKNSVKKTQKI